MIWRNWQMASTLKNGTLQYLNKNKTGVSSIQVVFSVLSSFWYLFSSSIRMFPSGLPIQAETNVRFGREDDNFVITLKIVLNFKYSWNLEELIWNWLAFTTTGVHRCNVQSLYKSAYIRVTSLEEDLTDLTTLTPCKWINFST